MAAKARSTRAQSALDFLSSIKFSTQGDDFHSLNADNTEELNILADKDGKKAEGEFAEAVISTLPRRAYPFSRYVHAPILPYFSAGFADSHDKLLTFPSLRCLFKTKHSIVCLTTLLKYDCLKERNRVNSSLSGTDIQILSTENTFSTKVKRKATSYGHLLHPSNKSNAHYDPSYLDDPKLSVGKHKTSMAFSSYLASVLQYAKDSDLKRDLNTRFRERNPDINEDVTLSKLRRLKQCMLFITLELDLEVSTVAKAYAFLEKLVLRNVVTKGNRKAIAGACLFLAAKTNEERGTQLFRSLIKSIEEEMDVDKDELIAHEFPVFSALEFTLRLSEGEIMPHFNRILTSLEYSNVQEYLGEKMYSLLFHPLSEVPEEGENIDQVPPVVVVPSVDEYPMSSYSYAYELDDAFDESAPMSLGPSVSQSPSDLEMSASHAISKPKMSSRQIQSESPEL